MTGPVVGAARVEITGDLSAFTKSADTEIRTAMGNAQDAVREGSGGVEAAAGQAGDGAGKSFAQKMKDGVGKGIDGVKKLAGSMLGDLGIGAAFAAAYAGAMATLQTRGTLQAKLGLSPAEAKTAGDTVGHIYAQAWGDSLETVTTAVAAVKQGLSGLVDDSQIEGLTIQALAFSDAFGYEASDSIRGVSQMLRTGLAKNAQEAFDILTAGMQEGDDKAGDLIDTFNEYSVQFQKLGLNARDALGLIHQGLMAGARDSDLVADALKEFAIRSQEAMVTAVDPAKVQQAQAAVAAAVKSASQAQVDAAQKVRDAHAGVVTAEGQLATAQKAEQTAQEALTQARKDARQMLHDLTLQVQDAALAERSAQLSVKQARVDLNKTMRDPEATELQRQQAQLTYDQAVQGLKEQRERTRDVQRQKAEADRQGVAGSRQVRDATKGVADANKGVMDASTALAEAHRKETQAAVDGAAQVRDAYAAVAKAQADAAAAATPQLTASGAAYKRLGLDGEQVGRRIAAGGNVAKAALSEVLAHLRAVRDPVERAQLATQLFGTQAEDLGAALFKLDPATASGAAGMDKVRGASDRATKAIGSTTPPMESLKRSIMGTVTALAADALPVMEPFFNLVAKAGPAVLVLAGGFTAMVAVTKVTNSLKAFNEAVLTAGARARIASAATKVWTAVQAAFNFVMNASPIMRIVMLVGLLVGAFIYAWKHSERFREIVRGVFNKIKEVIGAVVGWIGDRLHDAGKFFSGLWDGVKSGWNWANDHIFTPIKNIIGGIGGWISDAKDAVTSAAEGMFDALYNAAIWPVNQVIKLWNATLGQINFTIPGWVPFVGGKSFGFPHIQEIEYRAKGGPVGPNPTVVGEHGAEMWLNGGGAGGQIISNPSTSGGNFAQFAQSIAVEVAKHSKEDEIVHWLKLVALQEKEIRVDGMRLANVVQQSNLRLARVQAGLM